MKMMMQELEVWYVLPAVRRALAIALRKQGMKNAEIAKKFGLTKAAITHYFDNDRAVEFNLNKKIQKEISFSAKKIIDDEDVVSEMQRIAYMLKNNGSVCVFHHIKENGLEKNCDICFRK